MTSLPRMQLFDRRGYAMQLATWNVNSLNVRLPQVLAWLAANPVDVLALQELKLTDDKFPVQAFTDAGYHAQWFGQKTYNGVALLSKAPAENVIRNIPGFDDEQSRVLCATIAGVRVIGAYFPNGQEPGSDKFAYKMRWLDALREWVRDEMATHPQLVLMGDYNITFDDADVWDPPKTFSWWDYRMLGFQKNRGLRIDHILVTDSLKARATACEIDRAPRKNPQPSDHAPVVLTLS
jgi:exodeoxyribonuclease-3